MNPRIRHQSVHLIPMRERRGTERQRETLCAHPAHIRPHCSEQTTKDVFEKVLKAPITLETGELLAVARELLNMMQEATKPKPRELPKPTANMVAHSFSTKTRGI